MLLNSCSNHNEGKAVTRCGYFNKAALMAMDDADSIPRQPRDSGVLAKAFLLELTLWDVTWTCSAASHRFHGNEAYATVPSPGPTYEPNITSVTITSDHDFDANHPAGTELKDLFINTDPQYFHAGTNNLYLMHAPAQVSTHVFTIRLLFTDSSKNLVSSALPVKLLL